MNRAAVESMQDNLDRGKPAILACYGLTGAILLAGGCGLLVDRYLETPPWCLVAGLLMGCGIGLGQLVRVLRR
jgi:F0F1-type ATP synthase assembly protein I